MRWRFSKLSWSYGIGELVIVVSGVLIALAVDQWNSDRLARLEEVEIIDRFIVDLSRDLESIEFALERISTKRAELLRVKSYLDYPQERGDDHERFLSDVAGSARYGWNQARARRTTFDDVLASGRLSFIRETGVRVNISEYYSFDESMFGRIDERETNYPSLSYGLVPRVREWELAEGLDHEEMELLVAKILESSLPDAIVGEINFTQFLEERFVSWRSFCLTLTEELESYRQTIQPNA